MAALPPYAAGRDGLRTATLSLQLTWQRRFSLARSAPLTVPTCDVSEVALQPGAQVRSHLNAQVSLVEWQAP